MNTYLTKSVDIDDDAETSSSFDDVSQRCEKKKKKNERRVSRHHHHLPKSRRKKKEVVLSSRRRERRLPHVARLRPIRCLSRPIQNARETPRDVFGTRVDVHRVPRRTTPRGRKHQLSDVHGGTREEFHAEERRVEIRMAA